MSEQAVIRPPYNCWICGGPANVFIASTNEAYCTPCYMRVKAEELARR